MPAGRPSDYSEALVDRICDELMQGDSLVRICQADDMPHRVTVIRWLDAYPEFATRYARARASQADLMDDLILDVARESKPETALSDRIKIGAYQWRAMKLAPRKYGEKVETTVRGDPDAPVQTVTTIRSRDLSNDDLARIAARALPKPDGE